MLKIRNATNSFSYAVQTLVDRLGLMSCWTWYFLGDSNSQKSAELVHFYLQWELLSVWIDKYATRFNWYNLHLPKTIHCAFNKTYAREVFEQCLIVVKAVKLKSNVFCKPLCCTQISVAGARCCRALGDHWKTALSVWQRILQPIIYIRHVGFLTGSSLGFSLSAPL